MDAEMDMAMNQMDAGDKVWVKYDLLRKFQELTENKNIKKVLKYDTSSNLFFSTKFESIILFDMWHVDIMIFIVSALLWLELWASKG